MGKLDFVFENDEKQSLEELKKLILEEVNLFRKFFKEEIVNIENEIKK